MPKPQFLLFFVLAFMLLGCGGAGITAAGGTTGGNPAPMNGKSAAQTVAEGSLLFSKTRTGVGLITKKAASATLIEIARTALVSPQSSGWVYNSSIGFYTRVTNITLNSFVVQFSTDGTTNDAGSVKVTRLYGGAGHYPEAARLDFNLILGQTTITGPLTLVVNDSAWNDVQVQMNLASTQPPIGVASNVHAVGNNVTGDLSVTRSGSTVITLTNIAYSPSGFAADFATLGVQGDVTINADGSGIVHSVDHAGTWTLTWDTNQNAMCTAPDGTSAVISLQT